MNKKNPRKFVFYFVAVLTIFLIGIITWQAFPHPQKLEINEITSGGTVSLSISPSSSSLAPNTTIALSISINTNESKVVAVQAELTYPTDTCTTPSITQGSFLANVLSSPKVENGTIKFTFTAPPDSEGIQGSGTLATIQTGPTTGTCQLSFTQNTAVAAIGQTTNALASVSDATIFLITASPNPSPPVSISQKPASPLASPSLLPQATPQNSGLPSELEVTPAQGPLSWWQKIIQFLRQLLEANR